MNIQQKKVYIYENIDNSPNHNIIIKLLNDNECKYTKNSNGIFLNLNTLKDELIQNIYDILFFNNDKDIINMIEENHTEISIEEFLPKEPVIQQKKVNYDNFLLQNYSQKEQEIILFSKKYNL